MVSHFIGRCGNELMTIIHLFLKESCMLVLWFHGSFTEDICRWSNSFFFRAASIVEDLGPVLKELGFVPHPTGSVHKPSLFFSLFNFMAVVDFYNLPDRIKLVIYCTYIFRIFLSFLCGFWSLLLHVCLRCGLISFTCNYMFFFAWSS